MNREKGKLFLIPSYLDPSNTAEFISVDVQKTLLNITIFLVEDERTARRFISSLKIGINIQDLTFFVLDKETLPAKIDELMAPIDKGQSIGLISEAGLPCLADPGNIAVSFAHRQGIEVIPLPGTSSILLALISSGFNGQQFTFHGYLPIDIESRQKRIIELEKEVNRSRYTQIFMETPYRNNAMIQTLLDTLHPETLLYIGAGITSTSPFVKTLTVSNWKRNRPDLHKIPAIFAIGKF